MQYLAARLRKDCHTDNELKFIDERRDPRPETELNVLIRRILKNLAPLWHSLWSTLLHLHELTCRDPPEFGRVIVDAALCYTRLYYKYLYVKALSNRFIVSLLNISVLSA